MSPKCSPHLSQIAILGAFAGLAGGVVEIAWVWLYGALSGMPAAPVARGIVAVVIPRWSASSQAASLGVLIHLGLAIALGVSLAFGLRSVVRSQRSAAAEYGWVALALVAVWAVNFLVLLPKVSPGFVHLLPFWATMLSKLLFGFSAAAVLRYGAESSLRQLLRKDDRHEAAYRMA